MSTDLVNADAGFPLLGGGFAGKPLKLCGADGLAVAHEHSSPLGQESAACRIADDLDLVWCMGRPLQDNLSSDVYFAVFSHVFRSTSN